ncbi:hypothetical protein PoB_006254900 [Plakobranchus ocellatus]|uniref:Uncharacterized protein n=1 Tax=Plakobranchus ocellatus TaxID=259542 RepID=A0AAV4CVX7_9GAST|nr:hypothetical protein PoB_006254900 [Plakobranchus ocellatus]
MLKLIIPKQGWTLLAKQQEQLSKPSTATPDVCCAMSPLAIFHCCKRSVVCEKIMLYQDEKRLDELNQSEKAVVKKRFEEIEDKLISLICKQRQISRLFQFGPTSCSQCADSLPN